MHILQISSKVTRPKIIRLLSYTPSCTCKLANDVVPSVDFSFGFQHMDLE